MSAAIAIIDRGDACGCGYVSVNSVCLIIAVFLDHFLQKDPLFLFISIRSLSLCSYLKYQRSWRKFAEYLIWNILDENLLNIWEILEVKKTVAIF